MDDFDINIQKDDIPTIYWLPKLHKSPCKSRFIANSSNCSTTMLSKHLTSALTAVKNHLIKYCETVYNNSGVNYFWSIKNSGAIIDKMTKLNFKASEVIMFDFSMLYTTLPHNLIKAKLKSFVK